MTDRHANTSWLPMYCRSFALGGVALHGHSLLSFNTYASDWCNAPWRLFQLSEQQHPFNGPLYGTSQVSWYHKGKTNLDFTETTDGGSGISWVICKSAARPRQIPVPAPHHSIFYRLDALPAPNQQRQSCLKFFQIPYLRKLNSYDQLL